MSDAQAAESRATLQVEDAVAIVTLNHPAVMNAISPRMISDLLAVLDRVEATPEARCMLLTGAGRAFCAGANLQEVDDPTAASDAGAALETHYHPLLRRLRDLKLPLVTAVNGVAAGAGMSLALMGDLIVCGRSAYFLQAFRRIGLVPDCGSTWLLPRLIGRARALELSLLGEKLPAETAHAWGLVNRVVDDADLAAAALTIARDLAKGPTVALGLIRRLYWDSEENGYEAQLDRERQAQRAAGQSADFREGLAAFLAKRPAQFRGN